MNKKQKISQSWSAQEKDLLLEYYKVLSPKSLMEIFPDKDLAQLKTEAAKLDKKGFKFRT